MKVKDFMTEGVLTVNKEMTVKEFIRVMQDNNITGAPVVDDNDKIIGIISVTDVLKRSNYVNKELAHCEEEYDVNATTGMLEVHKYYTEELFEKQINCLMTAKEEIISVSPGDDIDKVVKTFLDTPVHRILVMEKGEAVGIISTKDALKALSKACKKEKQ